MCARFVLVIDLARYLFERECVSVCLQSIVDSPFQITSFSHKSHPHIGMRCPHWNAVLIGFIKEMNSWHYLMMFVHGEYWALLQDRTTDRST